MSGDYRQYLDNLDIESAFIQQTNAEILQSISNLTTRIAKLEKSNAQLRKSNAQLKRTIAALSSPEDENSKSDKVVKSPNVNVKKTDADLPAESEHIISALVTGVTIVIPTYRDNPYIAQAIESVLTQETAVKLTILVVVNCNNSTWFNTLKTEYAEEERVRVVLVEKAGVSAARNYSIQNIETSHVVFLDDDDYLTSGYIDKLVSSFTGDADIVCSPFITDGPLSEKKKYEYINIAIDKLRKQNSKKQPSLTGLFGTVAGKLFTIDFLRNCMPFNERIPDTEDVVFWANNYGLLKPLIGSFESDSEGYVRRIREGSLSRPDLAHEYEFSVTNRLAIISCLENIAFTSAVRDDHLKLVFNFINAQTQHLKRFFVKSNGETKERILNEINRYSGHCLNKGWFSSITGIAFCHNFSPTVDPSAFVATKRLRQIDAHRNIHAKWHVVSKSMADVRSIDKDWDTYYTPYVCVSNEKLPGRTTGNFKGSTSYAVRAFGIAKDVHADIIYSRAMFPGSHFAAYLYKKQHPETIWYAEFSDPISRTISGELRDEVSPVQPDLYDEGANLHTACELLPFEFADYLIFTNKVQMKYMLDNCSEKALAARAEQHALVWPHPTIESKFISLVPSDYERDESIQIAYFGSFYDTRRADDIYTLAKRNDVTVHLFLSHSFASKDMDYTAGFENIIAHEALPYFKFLNTASKMDYLFLSDMDSINGVTPWLPSKLSDYLATKAPIIARCNPGSPLETYESDSLIKVREITDELVQSLKKRDDLA